MVDGISPQEASDRLQVYQVCFASITVTLATMFHSAFKKKQVVNLILCANDGRVKL